MASYIERRKFLATLGAAAAWPLAARAQSSSGRPLIGVLSPLSPAMATRNIEALQAGLRDLGYVEGHNVTLVFRFAGGVVARLPELAAELVALKPDVIIAGSVSGILAARAATRRFWLRRRPRKTKPSRTLRPKASRRRTHADCGKSPATPPMTPWPR